MGPLVRIATRKSPLALWQAEFVKGQLIATHPNLEVQIVPIVTRGDTLLDRTLSKVGGKGLFLKELEVSLLNHETDIAVHSMKDVPVELPRGLEIRTFLEREDPRDAFVSNRFQNLYALPAGSTVGTSSLRRSAQIKHAFPTLKFVELRGNVNTRLAKLDSGDYDAIILAAAGLIRLGLEDRISQFVSTDLCVPAVGQGIIGIECRAGDKEVNELLAPIHSIESEIVLSAERSMNATLGGGCQVPVGGFAEIKKGRVNMRAIVGHPDGSVVLRSEGDIDSVAQDQASDLGHRLAEDLKRQGAEGILRGVQKRLDEDDVSSKPIVLLTRQQQFIGNTRDILKRLDYHAINIPTLEIKPSYDSDVLEYFKRIGEFTDLVFVSRNAVEIALSMIEQQGSLRDIPRVMTVGSETAKQLYKHGIDALFPNSGTGAEALLSVSQLQDMAQRRVLWVRGKQGLQWPAQALRQRGAEVVEAVCYRQSIPTQSASELSHALADNRPLSGVFVHSANALHHLMSIAAEQTERILRSTLVAGSESIAQIARDYAWQGDILVAESPSNKHMMIAFSN